MFVWDSGDQKTVGNYRKVKKRSKTWVAETSVLLHHEKEKFITLFSSKNESRSYEYAQFLINLCTYCSNA